MPVWRAAGHLCKSNIRLQDKALNLDALWKSARTLLCHTKPLWTGEEHCLYLFDGSKFSELSVCVLEKIFLQE